MATQQELLDEFNKLDVHITVKQKEYIKSLISVIKEIPPELLDKLKISDLSDEQLIKLTSSQIFILIEELKRLAPMGLTQSLLILNQFDNSDVNKLIKKDIRDLTMKDAETLLSGPTKFVPWIKEHPLISRDEFEYGWQESDKFADDKMYYLKFYNMMMLDVDTSDGSELILGKLLNQLKTINMKFRIYKTYNGYHVFIISELIKYNHPELLDLTKRLGGDIYYALFANKTGFKVRLNSKLGRKENYIARYVCEVGIKPANILCKKLIEIHDYYITQFIQA